MDLLASSTPPPHQASLLAAIGITLLLAGCADGGLSPLGSSVDPGLTRGGGNASPAAQADAITFASLVLNTPERSGLVVLGAVAGDTTLWPTGQQGSLALYRDGLAATVGFRRELLSLRYTPSGEETPASDAGWVPWQASTPVSYRIASQWREASGEVQAAEGRAELRCEPAQTQRLPLGSRPLEVCREWVDWGNGDISESRYYRSPQERRLWAAKVTPWPRGEQIAWEVARAWW